MTLGANGLMTVLSQISCSVWLAVICAHREVSFISYGDMSVCVRPVNVNCRIYKFCSWMRNYAVALDSCSHNAHLQSLFIAQRDLSPVTTSVLNDLVQGNFWHKMDELLETEVVVCKLQAERPQWFHTFLPCTCIVFLLAGFWVTFVFTRPLKLVKLKGIR